MLRGEGGRSYMQERAQKEGGGAICSRAGLRAGACSVVREGGAMGRSVLSREGEGLRTGACCERGVRGTL